MRRHIGRGLAFAALAIGAAACGASDGGEEASATGDAVTKYVPMPEGVCTLRAGADPAHLSGNEWPSSAASYPGTDPTVSAFQHDAASRGGTGTWWVTGYSGNNAWLAVDASSMSDADAAALANQWSGVAPVNAGYFTCTWLWGDFELPHGARRPYVPTRIVAFDPNCTKIRCAI